jgi:hypothetical protein
MQGDKIWILPKEINANRFFWDSHWLEIWSNHSCPLMGPNGGTVAMVSEVSDSDRIGIGATLDILIKKKLKFPSYIRKFRLEQLQSHI